MERKIRVLVGKPGLDGHDRGAKVVAAALLDAGMVVIYTGLHQTPEQIVEAALQEDVDVVALSILSGAHMTLFTEVVKLMKKHGIEDKLLTGGGIIPPDDMEALAKQGVGRLFGPGASTQDIGAYIRSWFAGRTEEEALAQMPRTKVTLTESPRARARIAPTSRAKARLAPASRAKSTVSRTSAAKDTHARTPRTKARFTGTPRAKAAPGRSGSRAGLKSRTRQGKRRRAAATGRR